jgi:hypothetical protein
MTVHVIEGERDLYEKYTNHLREQTNLEVFIDNVPDEDETKIKGAVRELLVAEVIELAHKRLRASGVSDELLKNSRKDLRTSLRGLPLPEKDQGILEEKVRRLGREMSTSPEAVEPETRVEPPLPSSRMQLLEHRSPEPIVQASHSWLPQDIIKEDQGWYPDEKTSDTYKGWWDPDEKTSDTLKERRDPDEKTSDTHKGWWDPDEKTSDTLKERRDPDEKTDPTSRKPDPGSPCICISDLPPGMFQSLHEINPLPAPRMGKNSVTIALFLRGPMGHGSGDTVRFEVEPNVYPPEEIQVGLSTLTGWARQIISWSVCKGKLASTYAKGPGDDIRYMRLDRYAGIGGCDGAHTIIFRKPTAPLGIWIDAHNLDLEAFWEVFGGTRITCKWIGPNGAFEF